MRLGILLTARLDGEDINDFSLGRHFTISLRSFSGFLHSWNIVLHGSEITSKSIKVWTIESKSLSMNLQPWPKLSTLSLGQHLTNDSILCPLTCSCLLMSIYDKSRAIRFGKICMSLQRLVKLLLFVAQIQVTTRLFTDGMRNSFLCCRGNNPGCRHSIKCCRLLKCCTSSREMWEVIAILSNFSHCDTGKPL